MQLNNQFRITSYNVCYTKLLRILSKQGYDLILVARRKEKLKQLKEELSTNVDIICTDLSSSFNCSRLYNKLKNENIDILINNAGFGVFGSFETIKLEKELDLIDINIKAVHILTKLFLTDVITSYSIHYTKLYEMPHISTGDILRNAQDDTERGKYIANEMAQGHFVSDEIILELLKERLLQSDCNNGYILDGFPRNIEQAKHYEEILANLNKDLGHVIVLDIDKVV